MKLDRAKIRKLIIKEIEAIGEDVLVTRAMADKRGTPPMQSQCEQCGAGMSEAESACTECGYESRSPVLEGNCGCETSKDYSTDTMGNTDVLARYGYDSGPVDTMSKIGDALGALTHAGYEVDATKDGQKNHNNYMAKPSLYKVSKYAKKLLEMIPDGYELDDWQRTKIAQISDDISEVYHSLDYDKFEGDI